MILGIDPSFTSTGVCLLDTKTGEMTTAKFGLKGSCYDSILSNHDACEFIIENIKSFVGDNTEDLHIICEYPALATKSGAYLAILNGYITPYLKSIAKSITWVPPTACDSFTKNKEHSKTYLVEWCKKNKLISKRTSHDECTAIIFTQLLIAIREHRYKNSSFTWFKTM